MDPRGQQSHGQRDPLVPALAVAASLAVHGLIVATPRWLEPPAPQLPHLLSFKVVRSRPPRARVVEKPVKPTPPAPRPHRATRTQPRPAARPRPPVGPPAPPVFGASKASVTDGESTFSVPLGNTVATSPENRGEIENGTPDLAPSPPPPPKPTPVTVRTKPRILQEVKVPYPAKARELGISGTVKVRVLVGADGKVQRTRVVSGPGFGLNEAARKALTRFRFQPAMGSNDKPMAYWITYRYTFQIED